MRLSSKAIAASALLSFSPLCLADFYLGGAGTVSALKYEDVSAGLGGQVFGGYKPESFPMTFEVGYLTSGKNKVDGTFTDGTNYITNVGVSFTGAAASLGYYGKFNRKGSGAYVKLGYYTGKSKLSGDVNGSPAYDKVNSNGAMFSFGVDLMITRYFGFRFDLGSLLSVKDYRDFDPDHKSNMTLASAGVIFAFGGSEPRYASRHQPAPVYTPVVAAAPVAPTPVAPVTTPDTAPATAPQTNVPEAAPVAAVPAAAPSVAPVAAPQPPKFDAVAGTQVVAIAGAVVRGQPSTKSMVATVLENGRAVRLDSQRIDNAEGSWWLVSGDHLKGWVNEKDLQR